MIINILYNNATNTTTTITKTKLKIYIIESTPSGQ